MGHGGVVVVVVVVVVGWCMCMCVVRCAVRRASVCIGGFRVRAQASGFMYVGCGALALLTCASARLLMNKNGNDITYYGR